MSAPGRKRGLPWGVLLAGLYLAAVLAVVVVTMRWGDDWWLATVSLFAPRWVWATPLVLLVPLCALLRGRLVSLAVLAASGLLLLYFNDFHLGLKGAKADKGAPVLRLMTYNIGGGHITAEALADLLVAEAVDAAAFPECGDLEREKLAAKGYQVRFDSGICLATRLPIKKVDVRDPKDFWDINGSGAINRFELEQSGRMFSLEIVHLETVREGLSEAIEFRFWKDEWKGPEVLADNIKERGDESRAATEWARRGASMPSVVMGDFNMPVDSAIYRTYWSSLHNALTDCAPGRKMTKFTRWFGIRIDHVLFDDGFRCKKAWTSKSLGGDHRPVIAELVWAK